MVKRIVWKHNHLVNIKLRDNLYTIGQMLNSVEMQFYDVCNTDGVWKNIDLNQVSILFRILVVNAVYKLMPDKIKDKSVVPNTQSYNNYWIKPYSSFDGDHYPGDKNSFLFIGGKLIDIGPKGNIGTTLAPILKEDLTLPEDRELIEKYELTNMWGPESLRERLCRYFDTGINRDDLKFEVFPGLWDDREQLRPLTSRLPVPLR
ncbi:hypothetical protein QPK14_11675 [Photorhabdus temperata subsp. temperata]|uniref:Uncharacterized protein n=1 Tax=Photorhabdus temperata J3 TaxID=1389415 RepID=U7QTQ8_PHOTE|nr:hypothetical protein [Photorhabdus temperata]ERT10455.1 hypothetical protein O185_24725 [Photorhabdus temperata J3]